MKIKNLLCSAAAVSAFIFPSIANAEINSLEDALLNQTGDRVFIMEEDQTITRDLVFYDYGTKSMSGDSIIINGNGYTIDGNGYDGLLIREEQKISINDADVTNFQKKGGTDYNSAGGFIYNAGGHIENMSGEYSNNSAANNGYDVGGVIINRDGGTINTINATFKNNTAGEGGAIYNDYRSSINTINGKFEKNTAKNGGAIYNTYNATIGTINADFVENTATQDFGGAIYNEGNIEKVEGEFKNNSAMLGGAIYNMEGSLSIIANETNTIFNGNKDSNGTNAIINARGIINLNANNEKSIIINDAIGFGTEEIENYLLKTMEGASQNEINKSIQEAKNIFKSELAYININAKNDDKNVQELYKNFLDKMNNLIEEEYSDCSEAVKQEIRDKYAKIVNKLENFSYSSGTIEINNKVKNQTVNMFDGTLKLGTNVQDGIKYSGTFDKNVYFNYYGGKVTLQNNGINHANFGKMTLNSEMDLSLDADLANEKMDTISADKFTSNDNKINISNINLISGAKKSLSLSPLSNDMDAETRQTMAESIIYSGGDVAYGDIYKYTVDYNKENAMLNFGLQGGKSNPTDLSDFAPAVASKPIAQSGAQNVQMDSYTEAFRNMDMFMLMPENERIAYKYRNKYAALTDDLVYDPTMSTYQNNTAWFRPYTTFEKVDLKNGPEVSNTSYGTYFGYDSSLTELGKGWDGTFGVYAGYNGSHQTFHGNSIYQNGGSLGVIGVAYKGNFFTGWTLNVGASAGSTSNMYGSDNFTSIMGGLSTKNGYNFEFADGKFILQPSVLLSYSLVNTFDYTNAAGVRMKSDPLHTLQIEPSIKLIGNIGTWQPYANVAMVWNILNETKVTANDVVLPEVSVRPYVKYGVGLQKKWADKFTAFGQCYVTNGGRNGVGLQAGLRIALGDETTKAKAAWLTPKKKDTVIVLDGKVK